jgi:secreted PhoX family phosphatase
MDRPEWCATHPTTGEICCTRANAGNRKLEPTAAQQGLDAAKPISCRGGALGPAGNINGHIVGIAEAGGASSATTFTWGAWLFGAQSDASTTSVNLKALTFEQDYSIPDGLWFSPTTQLCWIQTDDGVYTDTTHCTMRVGVPGKVGDGAKTTLNYTKADGSTVAIDTCVGKAPAADALRRVLVGPVDCEVTGCAETPDGKGCSSTASIPASPSARPMSPTLRPM